MSSLLIKNIGILQTPTGNESHAGSKQGENLKLKNAAIFIKNGLISEITCDGLLPKEADKADEVIDAEGKLVTPGLIDAHTHLVFGGFRQNEIPMKLEGMAYLDILKAGGGILDTVRKTRTTGFEELYKKSFGFLTEMLAFGVTTCEAKSGYGLDIENETKQLKVMEQLKKEHKVELVSTFMGAHAVPDEYKGRSDDYIDFLCEEMLPYIAENKLAAYCDIFCEDSVFNVEQSRKYLSKAKELGFGLKIHADEIEEIGGSELAGEMGAVSAEHLIAAGENGMAAMAKAGTIAMLLPATSFYLNKTYAPARRMIELEIPVAIASDFNPGSCPSLNLQFAITLGYLKYRMKPEEVLTAVTINAACAIGKGQKSGTLEIGKQADVIIWNSPDMEMLCYRFGSNMAWKVIKKGELI
jgi:imidazolonepropionase